MVSVFFPLGIHQVPLIRPVICAVPFARTTRFDLDCRQEVGVAGGVLGGVLGPCGPTTQGSRLNWKLCEPISSRCSRQKVNGKVVANVLGASSTGLLVAGMRYRQERYAQK